VTAWTGGILQPANEGGRRAWAGAIVLAAIAAYALFFSALALQRHAALQTAPPELSYVDQAMWNSLHGRLLELTLGREQVSRLALHFEPLLVPLSLAYLAVDDVRTMLLLQAVVAALGALPLYWIARRWLKQTGGGAWISVACAFAYLLYPALQQSVATGLSVEPFFATSFLFAFWYALERRWGRMWVWAVAAMMAREDLALMVGLLGVWVFLFDAAATGGLRMPGRRAPNPTVRTPATGVRTGIALLVLGCSWYLIAQLWIIGPARSAAATDGLAVLTADGADQRISGESAPLRPEPAASAKLGALFAATGWLALAGPEVLLLGLPLLLTSLAGDQQRVAIGVPQMSAALAPVFVLAAAWGARRVHRLMPGVLSLDLLRPSPSEGRRDRLPEVLGGLIAIWLLAWSMGQQVQSGWTPLSRVFTWPQRTDHTRALARFAHQIPDDAIVSTSASLHPHLAHRPVIYQLPVVSDAEWVLVDASDVSSQSPEMLGAWVGSSLKDGEFGIEDAGDGFLLLRRGAARAELPDAFYDFLRHPGSLLSAGAHPVLAGFGDAAQLVGYQVIDSARSGRTVVRTFWQADSPPAEGMRLTYRIVTPWGEVREDAVTLPAPALSWYPPEKWRPGETVVVELPPSVMPREWAPIFRLETPDGPLPAAVRAEPQEAPARPSLLRPPVWPRRVVAAPDGWVQLPASSRVEGQLAPYDSPLDSGAAPVSETAATFDCLGWRVSLARWGAPIAVAPGGSLPVYLEWQAESTAERDFHVLLQLRDETGRNVSEVAGEPTWFAGRPTTSWAPAEAGRWDAHLVPVPEGLAPGTYTLVAGWLDPQSGERLPKPGAPGNTGASEHVLGPVTVSPAVRSAP
jgi:hypothetical protein